MAHQVATNISARYITCIFSTNICAHDDNDTEIFEMNLDKRKLHRLFQLEIYHLKLLNRYSSLESQVHMLTHLWFMDYLNEVMSYLANRKLVLEVGCGGGYFANLLQQAGYDVLAGDIIDPKLLPVNFGNCKD